jgi:hypothetical protein
MQRVVDGDVIKCIFFGKVRIGFVCELSDMTILYFPTYKVGRSIEYLEDVSGEYLGNANINPELLNMALNG